MRPPAFPAPLTSALPHFQPPGLEPFQVSDETDHQAFYRSIPVRLFYQPSLFLTRRSDLTLIFIRDDQQRAKFFLWPQRGHRLDKEERILHTTMSTYAQPPLLSDESSGRDQPPIIPTTTVI